MHLTHFLPFWNPSLVQESDQQTVRTQWGLSVMEGAHGALGGSARGNGHSQLHPGPGSASPRRGLYAGTSGDFARVAAPTGHQWVEAPPNHCPGPLSPAECPKLEMSHWRSSFGVGCPLHPTEGFG